MTARTYRVRFACKDHAYNASAPMLESGGEERVCSSTATETVFQRAGIFLRNTFVKPGLADFRDAVPRCES